MIQPRRVVVPRDDHDLAEFLCMDEWPFHGRRHLTLADVTRMDFASMNATSFWLVDEGQTVGLIRVFDLGDIGEGAPQFDLRIASRHRGRGCGTAAVQWTTEFLFTSYPQLHRIEANTRDDNTAMQRVLSNTGFSHEGRLRESWRGEQQRWFDTMVYGILRSDWSSHTDVSSA